MYRIVPRIFRFEETNNQSKTCKPGEECIGGLARIVTVIKTLKEVRKNTNPIYLNAGDNFQGTLFYTLGRWNITQHFMNLMRPDAMVFLFLCLIHLRKIYIISTRFNSDIIF